MTRTSSRQKVTVDVGDVEIGAVEIKDASTSLRSNVKSDGVNNALVVVQNNQPLPTGAATATNQQTEIDSLTNIEAGIPDALGQTTMSASMPVTIASDQSKIETIDTTHKLVHSGKYFSGGYFSSSIADTASIYMLVQNGSSSTHAVISATVGGESTITLYEGTTFSAAGTAVSMANHNRTSINTFNGTVTHTPTITTNGTQINGTGFIPGGGKNSAVGGSFEGFGSEFILAPNTNYLVQVTNISGGKIKGDIMFNCYQT